jgi:hypothetical protein
MTPNGTTRRLILNPIISKLKTEEEEEKKKK